MNGRKPFNNKAITLFLLFAIISMLFPMQGFAKSDVASWEFKVKDYNIVLNYLPKEIMDEMNKGFHINIHGASPVTLWQGRMKLLRFRDVSYITGEFINITITPHSNHSSIYIYSYYVSARNAYKRVLFYQQVSVLYYKANNITPTILTHSENKVNKFKLTWFKKDINQNITKEQIICNTNFHGLITLKTYNLLAGILYNSTGVLKEYGGVKIS